MVVLVAAPRRHEDLHGEKTTPCCLRTIREDPTPRHERIWTRRIDPSTGVMTRYLVVKTMKAATYSPTFSGRSTRSICKEIMQKCYDKVGVMSTTRKCTQQQMQSRKDRKMKAAISNYYSRRITAMWKEICVLPAQSSAVADRTGDKEMELQQKPDKRLIKESTKQPTITDEPSATPSYTFIAR